MKKINRESRIRISLVIGFIAFLFAGLDSLEQNQLLLATSNFLLAIVNLANIFFIKEKKTTANIILLFLNACLAFIVSYSYFTSDKGFLPLAWLVVGLFYVILSIKAIKKNKQHIVNQNINI